MSTTGDRPFFRGGVQNPAVQLNDLATRVGLLEGTRYLPPLEFHTTPSGAMVSVREPPAPPAGVEIVQLISSGETPPTGYLDAQIVYWDAVSDTYTSGPFIWLKDLNG